jgi:hypothetical protein
VSFSAKFIKRGTHLLRTDDPSVDLVATARQASHASSDIFATVHSFELLAAQPIRRLWKNATKNHLLVRLATETSGRASISVVFVSRKDHAVALKEYFGDLDGTVTETPAKFIGSGFGMQRDLDYHSIGVSSEANTASATD